MRIINLSVDGIRQAAERGLFDWLEQQDADVICLQDLRLPAPELEDGPYQVSGYHAYFFDSGIDDAYGVGIYTREQPKALIYGLGFSSGVDMQGRYIQADFERLSIGSLLAPQITDDPDSAQVKQKFFDDLQAHLHKITRKRREFIFCGNWGMAHQAIDVQNAKDNEARPGFMAGERMWMDQLYSELGYVDAFRQVNKDKDEFTWWPSGVPFEGDGWRTDLQVISGELRNRVEYAAIYKTQTFSSHLPVIMDYDLELPSAF
ncbi:exodeoxyribonuclease III [Gilvimarinus sp. F26214L]|uniref:exodeoxyribonuclease III n=1 Tax=Gilvimarinus sp. DZF01 TaxID=3461371 RepID=UPI0040451A7D